MFSSGSTAIDGNRPAGLKMRHFDLMICDVESERAHRMLEVL